MRSSKCAASALLAPDANRDKVGWLDDSLSRFGRAYTGEPDVIAEELGVSVKSVEWHVSHILRKLSITSRAAWTIASPIPGNCAVTSSPGLAILGLAVVAWSAGALAPCAAGAADDDDKATTSDVDDAPVVKFLHKMLLDAFSQRASDIHFEPYEHQYRVRFRIDGELREIASPPIAIKDKLADAYLPQAELQADKLVKLQAMIDEITRELSAGNKVTLTGFGTFKVSNRAAREGINPQTKQKIMIPAMTVPKFTAGKGLKEAVK